MTRFARRVLRLQKEERPRMHVRCHCPSCEQPVAAEILPGDRGTLRCANCSWERPIPPAEIVDDAPRHCLCCGSPDLWRQKDFPQSIGFLAVAAGAILSSIAWYYRRPVWAFGILMAFAALDMLFYVVMPDVLVCYRCSARHGGVKLTHEHEAYNRELGERYRQEAIRMAATSENPHSGESSRLP